MGNRREDNKDDSLFLVDWRVDICWVKLMRLTQIIILLFFTQFTSAQLKANEWTLYDNHISGETVNCAVGSSVAISKDGSVVAIGAWENNNGGYKAGNIKIYEATDNSLSQIGSTINGSQSWARLGSSVALNDDGNVIALFENNGVSVSGYVKVIEWNEELNLHVPKGGQIAVINGVKRESLALSSDGDTLLIGEYNHGVSLYDFDGSNWVRRVNRLGANAGSQDESGSSVAMSADGNIIVFGAPASKRNFPSSYINIGEVKAYEWIDNAWEEIDVGTGIEVGARVGTSVALSADGSRLAVGAKSADSTAGNGIGSVEVFQKSSSGYNKVGQTIYGDDGFGYFGTSVAISSDGNVITATGAKFIRSYEWNVYKWDKIGEDINYDLDGAVINSDLTTILSLGLSGDGNLIIIGDGTDTTGGIGNGEESGIASLFYYQTPPSPKIPVSNLDTFYESQNGQNITVDAVPVDGWPTTYTYQWYFNNFAIPALYGGTDSSITISGSEISNGTYGVNIANSTGAINIQFEYRVFSDNDSDGLSDYRESNILNTDPNSADTDGDSLGDSDEVNVYFTNPTLSDTNGDGFNDGFIIVNGFDKDEDYTAFLTYAKESLIDLRPGSTMIEVENGQATLSMELEQSSDLESWSEIGDAATMVVPADTDTKFFRFKMTE